MLGEMLGENTGRRLVRRMLEATPPTVEVSFEDAGKYFGVMAKGFGTYQSVIHPDGSIHGEGQGILMSAEGDAATWKGSGQGKFGANGAVSYRGILFFQSATGKLARLTACPAIFEYEVDSEGATRTKLWEWK